MSALKLLKLKGENSVFKGEFNSCFFNLLGFFRGHRCFYKSAKNQHFNLHSFFCSFVSCVFKFNVLAGILAAPPFYFPKHSEPHCRYCSSRIIFVFCFDSGVLVAESFWVVVLAGGGGAFVLNHCCRIPFFDAIQIYEYIRMIQI